MGALKYVSDRTDKETETLKPILFRCNEDMNDRLEKAAKSLSTKKKKISKNELLKIAAAFFLDEIDKEKKK